MINESNLKVWVDGTSYHLSDIPNYLNKYFDYNPGDISGTLRFVGIHINKNVLNVMLPKNVSKYTEINSELLSLIVRALTSNLLVNNDDMFDQDMDIKSDLFKTIEWLIIDFKNNGIVNSNRSIKNKKRGKINWTKTLKTKLPILQNENFVPINFVMKRKSISMNELSIIHSAVMSDISNKFGIYFDDFSYHSDDNISLKNKTRLNIIISKSKRNNNETRKRELIKKLSIYLGLDGNENGEFSIVTSEFHVVFENMMKKLVNHVESLTKYVPSAKWNFHLPNVKRTIQSTNNQIPDALVNHNGYLDIYDAKYYDLSKYVDRDNYNSTPLDWYSVGKQFFYQESFDYVKSGLKEGTNYFVFPFQLSNSYANKLKIDVGDVTMISSQRKNYRVIISLMDPIKMMKCIF